MSAHLHGRLLPASAVPRQGKRTFRRELSGLTWAGRVGVTRCEAYSLPDVPARDLLLFWPRGAGG